jgi:hypothetical protein
MSVAYRLGGSCEVKRCNDGSEKEVVVSTLGSGLNAPACNKRTTTEIKSRRLLLSSTRQTGIVLKIALTPSSKRHFGEGGQMTYGVSCASIVHIACVQELTILHRNVFFQWNRTNGQPVSFAIYPLARSIHSTSMMAMRASRGIAMPLKANQLLAISRKHFQVSASRSRAFLMYLSCGRLVVIFKSKNSLEIAVCSFTELVGFGDDNVDNDP